MSFKPPCSNYIKSVMFLIKVYALFCAGTLKYLLQDVRKQEYKGDRVYIKEIICTVSNKIEQNPSLCH
jgi:hypothetical protein